MASSVTFRAGDRVQELARPFRKGTVMAVTGLGPAALVTVSLDNWHPVTFRPSDLELL